MRADRVASCQQWDGHLGDLRAHTQADVAAPSEGEQLAMRAGLALEGDVQAVGAVGVLVVRVPADLAEVYLAVGYSDSVASE